MADATQRVPWVVGGGLIVAGLALGLWPRNEPTAPAPTASPPTAPLPSAASVPDDGAADHVDYVPDLSGPAIGEVLVAGASMAHGLVIAQNRLAWLLTDGATLGSSRLDGGDAVVVFASDDADAFGGVIASSPDWVAWSVELEGDEPEAIFRIPASALGRPLTRPEPVVLGASPDHLASADGELVWVDLGRISRLAGERSTLVATLAGRVVSLGIGGDGDAAAGDAGADVARDTAWWLEAPMEGAGAHRLTSMRLSQREPKVRVDKLEPLERDLLTYANGRVFWAESRDNQHQLKSFDPRSNAVRTVAATGLVTAIWHDANELVWVELVGEEKQPISLIRALQLADPTAQRQLGRVDGHVTALIANATHLFWSSAQGIERHPRSD